MARTTLMTKFLLPRRREDLLTRQRLLDQLYDMIDRRVVIVSAPAGYGKTTLLVDFAHDLEHPVCWFTLDAADRDPHVFLKNLVLSIQRRFPQFGERTLRAVDAASDLGDGAPGIVKVMINEVVEAIPQWFALVLDDYHALGAAPAVDAILSNFLAYQTDQCLTLLTSRVVPDLPLIIRLVARGGVGGIGQAELRFRAEEVQALFAQNYDASLTPMEAEALVEESEGWITGLLLTAAAEWQGMITRLIKARDGHRPVHDYLAHEVFAQQDEAMQRFLLDSSTLQEMNAERLRGILGCEESAEMLDRAEIRNLFVVELEEGWYRYHRIFADYLQMRLRETEPARWRDLHLQAAAWFEAQDRQEEAVDHYLRVGDLGAAAALMTERAHDVFVDGRLTTLLGWGETLDEDVLLDHPSLVLFQSRAAERLGRLTQALGLATLAESGYRQAEEPGGVAYAMLQRCQVWLHQGAAPQAEMLARETLEMIEVTGAPVAYEAYRMLGESLAAQGRWDEATVALRRALDLCETEGTPYTCASIQSSLAECLNAQGHLREALEAKRVAVETWRYFENDGILAGELNGLGFFSYAAGSYAEALRWFEDALRLARQTGQRRGEAFALVSMGELARDLGLLQPARRYCEKGLVLAESLENAFLTAYSREALGLIHRAAGRLDEAQVMIEEALSRAERQGADQHRGRYRASMGIVRVEAGDREGGLADLDQAMVILEPLGASIESRRARFLRAWALFLSGEKDRAVEALRALRRDKEGMFETLVLISEGQHAVPLLEYARERWIDARREDEAAWVRRALTRIANLDHMADWLFPETQSPSPPEASEVRVYGFGVGRVGVNGDQIAATDWGSASARNLLFYMMLHGSRSREQIFADFWPTLSPQKAKAAFHTTKFRLKRALGVDAIEYDGRVYRIDPEFNVWFDVQRFEDQLDDAETDEDVTGMIEAVRLYDGDFLQDCYDDWCIETRTYLRERCLDALETLSARLLARRQYQRAVEVLQRALALEPARESFHRRMMRAHVRSGERSQALRQYERCEETLRSEFGVDPSRRTRQLYQRILDEEPLD